MSVAEKLSFGFSRSLPVILQTEVTECGLACLAMVLHYHGYESDLPTLRQRFSVSLKGTTLKHLMQIAGQLKLSTRPLRLELEDLEKLPTPCILHWNFNHFVVLKEVTRTGVVVHDPGYGVRKLSFAEVSKQFTGVALEVAPMNTFKAAKEVRTFSWRQLIGSTHGLKRSLSQVFALALALEALVILGPILHQWLYDHVFVTGDRNLLKVLALGLLLLEVLRVGINVVRGWVVMIMSATLNIQWIANVFSHLMRLPIPWFEKRNTGDVISRFNAVHAIQGSLTTRFVETVLDGFMSIGALLMMLTYNVKLSLIVVAVALVYCVLRLFWYRRLRQINESEIVLGAKQQGFFLESLRAVRAIRLFNAVDDRKSRWLNHLVDERNAGLQMQRAQILIEAGNSLLFVAQNATVIWLGSQGVLDNEWSIGMLLAFLSYKEQFARRAAALVDKCVELRMLRVQAERLADIVLTEPEAEHLSSVEASELSAHLEVSGLKFRYGEGEPWVLHELNLSVAAGESVALIGASGCGKTTLLKLMLGLADPGAGEVRYGGIRLNQLGTAAYRDLIGVVMQDDQLISGSVADNIAFFATAPDQERIEECARIAAIHDEIRAMPMGYHTLVGDMGTTLSGGQKQRILLARALYRRPKILFLDEATSHLDVMNESLVNQTVRQLGITSVIIAHRPETIRMADRVVLVQSGTAVELAKSSLEFLAASAPAPAPAPIQLPS